MYKRDDNNNILSFGNNNQNSERKKTLADLEHFSLNDLINKLHQRRQIRSTYMIIFIIVVFISSIFGIVLAKTQAKNYSKLPCLVNKKAKLGKVL